MPHDTLDDAAHPAIPRVTAPDPPPLTALSGWLAAHPRGVHWLAHLLMALAAVLVFVLALRVLVRGAGLADTLLDGVRARGAVNLLGFGWLNAYAVLSGSPVAATALTLLEAGVLTPLETFGQIVGSRMGASFIALGVGFLYYLRGQRLADSVHVGVVALLVSVTTMTPAFLLGVAALDGGWLDGVHTGTLPLVSLISDGFDPTVRRLDVWLPSSALFVGGVAIMLLAFKLFDSILPTPEAATDRLARVQQWLRSRWIMFALGAGVTLLTLSVSLSITLLVPLALRGLIRRDAVIPYVMGANITTFIDTLFAAAVLTRPEASTVVLTTMLATAAVSSVLLLGGVYGPYARAILGVSRRVSRDRRSLAAFLAVLFAAPLVLMLG